MTAKGEATEKYYDMMKGHTAPDTPAKELHEMLELHQKVVEIALQIVSKNCFKCLKSFLVSFNLIKIKVQGKGNCW